MLGITLALFSAAASGSSIILVRKYSTKSSPFNISLIITLVGMAMLWPLAVLLTDFENINLLGLLIFAASGVLAPGIARLLYFSGLKKLGAPVNSSIFSIYPLYSSLLAVSLLSEILLFENWIGILLVFAGGILVGMSHGEIDKAATPSKKNLIFPISGGVTLAIGSIIRKYALDLYNAPLLGVAVAYTCSLLPYALMLTRPVSTPEELSLKRDLRLFWKAGVVQAVSWILSFYALSFAEVSVINWLQSAEPIFVAVFAYLSLREVERVSPKLVVSIVLTVFGVILVATKL